MLSADGGSGDRPQQREHGNKGGDRGWQEDTAKGATWGFLLLALGMSVSVGQSINSVQTDISQQLLDKSTAFNSRAKVRTAAVWQIRTRCPFVPLPWCTELWQLQVWTLRTHVEDSLVSHFYKLSSHINRNMAKLDQNIQHKPPPRQLTVSVLFSFKGLVLYSLYFIFMLDFVYDIFKCSECIPLFSKN